MQGPNLSNIKAVLSRINQIENIGNPQPVESLEKGKDSFGAILRKTLDFQNISPTFIDLSDPKKIVKYQDFPMQAQTAARFQGLEALIAQAFPGREIIITSTTDGRHSDPNHYAGKAVDFVVDGLTNQESIKLEELCKKAGFSPYNEYTHSSRYKTGPHMHIDLVE